MSQSLAKVYIHVVFSTKNAEAFISEDIRMEVQAYFVTVLSNIGSFTFELYVNPDHVHILCTLPRTLTMSDLVSNVKTPSSKLIKEKGVDGFSWQRGYGIFSVSASKVDVVKRYIQNQPSHHDKTTFKDEMRLFFREYGIDYDERYVWD